MGWVSLVAQMVKNPPAMQQIWFRSPGPEDPLEEKDNPLQYSCLGDPMDRGAWWATVHRVAELGMTERLTHTHTHTHRSSLQYVGFLVAARELLFAA